MRNFHSTCLSLLFVFGFLIPTYAHVGPNAKKKKKSAAYRFDCAPAIAQTDLAINNVRALLKGGGDIFAGGDHGSYIVPKRDPNSGLDEVSSIYAASLWMSGFRPGTSNPSLLLAADGDFYPGPLNYINGQTNVETCLNWDRFFTVSGEAIQEHLINIKLYQSLGIPYPAEEVPMQLKEWPAIGNPFFKALVGFDLPDAQQGLGSFWDSDMFGPRDGLYDPTQGDYPTISIRGCAEPRFADEMTFWVYNDAGGIHETGGAPIRMEVQATSFAYKSLDDLNNMTFHQYKLVNRAPEPIDSMFFAMWMDVDLGCGDDDFIGCDTASSMMYAYNEDATDGNSGCDCTIGTEVVPTYCNDVPILGVDLLRGPLTEPRLQADGSFRRVELGMTSFTYYNRAAGNPLPGTTDPTSPIEYYRMLNGYWRDGTALTYGGSGYQDGTEQIKYAFTEGPDKSGGWSMCEENLNSGDRRTLQSVGPIRLNPGDINEWISAVIWLPEADYPCPSIQPLLRADQRAQSMFDNCLTTYYGPDAPTMYPVELDQEVIFSLVNEPGSNNEGLQYALEDPTVAGLGLENTEYLFEGYRVFQLANENVTITNDNLNDLGKAREILTLDLKNGVCKLYNWEAISAPPSPDPIWIPTEQVSGNDEGVLHSFSVTEDAFSNTADKSLINFKRYYFTIIAYAYNNFEDFDPDRPSFGQRRQYLTGQYNVRSYAVLPWPPSFVNVNSEYGEGLEVTRLDGDGVVNNTLLISKETRERIARENELNELTWLPDGSAINARVVDPKNIKDGNYVLTFDEYANDPLLESTKFTVEDLETGEVVTSATTLERINENLLAEFGFSVNFGQNDEPGTNVFKNTSNGFLGSWLEYEDLQKPRWYSYFEEGQSPTYNFIKTDEPTSPDIDLDPNQVFTTINETGFYPFLLLAYDTTNGYVNPDNGFLYSPSWFNAKASQIRRKIDGLSNLNNVDIVFTSNRDLWSKCIVVQAANYIFEDQIGEDERSMDLLQRPSASKVASATNDFLPADADDGTVGYSYFPGYAVDVETGKRLNIFFGENTRFDPELPPLGPINGELIDVPDEFLTGNDRIWNPNVNDEESSASDYDNLVGGGNHFIFLTDLTYDGCKLLHDTLLFAHTRPLVFQQIIKQNVFHHVAWSGFPRLASGENLLSYKDGLIPNDLVISLRVKNPFQKERYTGNNNGFNQYGIKVEGKETTPGDDEKKENALDLVNAAPNPYLAYSPYENGSDDVEVKITHLPPESEISIYSLDGTFIRRFEKNQITNSQSGDRFLPVLSWDLTNYQGKPIVSGVYYIHVKSPEGERVIKWFGANRDMSQ